MTVCYSISYIQFFFLMVFHHQSFAFSVNTNYLSLEIWQLMFFYITAALICSVIPLIMSRNSTMFPDKIFSFEVSGCMINPYTYRWCVLLMKLWKCILIFFCLPNHPPLLPMICSPYHVCLIFTLAYWVCNLVCFVFSLTRRKQSKYTFTNDWWKWK